MEARTLSVPSELLSGLSADEVGRVLALGHDRHLTGGEILFDLGAEAADLYVVRAGQIALTLPMTVRGRSEDVLIEDRGPGQTVGWSALIPPHRFTLKATARLGTDLIVLPRAALVAYFEQHPAVGHRVARNVAAVVGQRLQVFQAMWLRQMQQVVRLATERPL